SLSSRRHGRRRGRHSLPRVPPSRLLVNGFGGGAAFVTNFGLHPVVDLRTGVDLLASGVFFSGASAYNVTLGVPVHLQLSLGNLYSMRMGPRIGVNFRGVQGSEATASFFAGPSFAPAVFRLGEKGNFELALQGDIDFVFVDGATLMNAHVGPRLTVLFLPD